MLLGIASGPVGYPSRAPVFAYSLVVLFGPPSVEQGVKYTGAAVVYWCIYYFLLTSPVFV